MYNKGPFEEINYFKCISSLLIINLLLNILLGS